LIKGTILQECIIIVNIYAPKHILGHKVWSKEYQNLKKLPVL
jgi:hypothetical protein